MNLPEGVQLSVSEPNAQEDNFRYVPDLELKQLKEQLDELTRNGNASPQTPESDSNEQTDKK